MSDFAQVGQSEPLVPSRPARSRHVVGRADDRAERDADALRARVMARLTTGPQQDVAPPWRERSTRVRRSTAREVIRRSPESEKLMAKMAVPQVLQLAGPEIEVQDALVKGLNDEIDDAVAAFAATNTELDVEWRKLANKNDPSLKKQMEDIQRQRSANERTARNYGNVTYIGAIVLTEPVGETSELIQTATLVDLPPVDAEAKGLKHSLQFGTYHLVKKAGLEKLVIANTLTTMEKASQMAYLREAGLPNETHAIVIEVHYYRSRGTGETKIHKDTRGETLFVNLNFPNKKQMLGPEYIINPASHEIYDQFVKEKLPEVFVDDLNAVKGSLPGQKYIHATVVKENGVVAFVDEAIHHKTPTPGHRSATADRIGKAIRGLYGDEYDDADRAYKAYTKAGKYSVWTWASYLKNAQAYANSSAWWELMDKLETDKYDKVLDRTNLGAWLPAYFRGHVDRIVEQAATDFTSVGFSHVQKGKILTVPVSQRGDAPLTRQMSEQDLSRFRATAEEGAKRTFFRTWVRAVPHTEL